jgi:hypothetical protein
LPAAGFASAGVELIDLELPDATIESAQFVPIGDFATEDKVSQATPPASYGVVVSGKASNLRRNRRNSVG